MHELGIVFHIIKEVKEIAEENSCSRISKVVMEIGEVSTIVPYYLEDCWKWAVAKDDGIMRGCELSINVLDAITHCDACGQDYPTVKHGKVCPCCGSDRTWLLQGNEVQIKQIEVE